MLAVVNAASTMGGADKEPDEPIGFESVLPVAQAAAPRGISAGAARWRTAKNTLAIRHLARRDKTGRMQSRKTVGRDAELKEAKRKLKDLQQGLDGGILIFEGGAGLGKTHMCRDVIKHAGRSGLLPLRGYCQALKDSTPYFPFQSLLEELFEVTFMPTAAARQSIVDQVTDKWPHLLERLGLLNAVLPFHFDETMKVSVLTGFARLEGTKRYLLELLQAATESLDNMVLIFEDVHWMDSLSWSLLADVSSSIHPLLIVITHREWPQEFPPPVRPNPLFIPANPAETKQNDYYYFIYF
eukprot:COSAG04_NODE_457_length_14036_cov_27.040109_1_plen_298_part_00